MKRALSLVMTSMLFCFVLLYMNVTVSAASSNDLTFTLNSDGESYSVTDCKETASGELVIPSTYNSYPVTRIGSYAFQKCTSIISVTVPDTVTLIGNSAFNSCSNLESFVMGKNVSSIGDYAFYRCGSLNTAITIPAGVTSIGEGVFAECSSLPSVTIPSTATTIGKSAFNGCSNLTSIDIPNGVTSIGPYAFAKCSELTSIIIPDSVTNIGNSAFNACSNIKKIDIGDNVVQIGDYAFYCCERINVAIIIPEGVTSIGAGVFSRCSNLPSVTIPNTVTVIGDSAFKNCTNLSSIIIPNGVKTIGLYAFADCSKLESVIIPNSVTNMVGYTFYNCSKLKSVSIGNGIKTINGYMFYNCGSLASVKIPESVTRIERNCFYSCSNIRKVYINDFVKWCNISFYGYYSNPLFYGSELYLNNKLVTKVSIPNGVTRIGFCAFTGCTSITSITIPDSVTDMGDYAFYNCSKLKSATIDKGISYISNYAFQNCTSLVSVTIPFSVWCIGDSAFRNCTNLGTVYYTGTKDEWDINRVGKNNESLLNARLIIKCDVIEREPRYFRAAATNEIGGIQVKWNKVSRSTEYFVYRESGYNTWTRVGSTTGNTFLDKNVKSGVSYRYSVITYNMLSPFGEAVEAYTESRKYMATPKLTTIYNHTNGLAIKWNAVGGVTNGYRVYRRGAGSTYWTYLGTTKNLFFIDNAVKNKSGEYFRYTVIADGGYHSKFDTTGLYLRRLANPTLTSAVSSKTGITVKWGAVKGATGYYVYRKTANSSWVRVATVGGTNSTIYIDMRAVKGTTYTYTVKAVCGSVTSSYNSGISCYDKY